MKANTMTLRYGIRAAVFLAALIVAGGGAAAFAKEEKASCPAFKAIDPDNDGTLDLNEAKAATRFKERVAPRLALIMGCNSFSACASPSG
jgi:hypothetical protein